MLRLRDRPVDTSGAHRNRKAGPVEKLKVGVLGLGRGFTHFVNFLNVEEAIVIGAADRFPRLRERAAERADSADADVQIVAEFDELLNMQPDAIIVATNGKLQVEHSIQAMQAGCHVLSEVPGAYTEEEMVYLKDAVQRTGMTYMLAENACFWDFLRYWRKWTLDDRFGPISMAEGEYLHYLPATLVRPDGTRCTPTEARAEGHTDLPPIWRADQPPIQYLTHDLGPLLEVIDDRVVSVTCRSAPWRCEETPLRSDGQFALFETAKGCLIRILVTLSTRRPGDHRFRLFGTLGGAEYFTTEGFCRRLDRDREESEGWEKIELGLAARGDDTSTGHGGADLKVAQQFTRAVLQGKPSPIDVYRCIEYCLPGIIANRSAEMGGVPLPVPDMRPEPFVTTGFWDVVGLPDIDPSGEPPEQG